MISKGLTASIQVCEEALEKLNESLIAIKNEPKKSKYFSFLQDTCIKRYEILFEYAWKLFKTAAEYQGSEVPGPRPAIQEALNYGWIDEGEFWADALDARNGSVHDYFGISHEDYLDLIERFAGQLPPAIKKINALM